MGGPDATLAGSALEDLVEADTTHEPPLDLAVLAGEVADHGDRTLTAFTPEELAATTPSRPALPGPPEDGWLAGLDTPAREVALAAATRSLAARRLVTPASGRLRLHGDLRIVHELRARATTVVQVEVRRGTARAHHLACRPRPGLVLHLAAAGGAHHAALRSEPSLGLLLASVLVDPTAVVEDTAPPQLPPAAVGADLDRLRRVVGDPAAGLVAVATHVRGDGATATSRVGLFATDEGHVLWRPRPAEPLAEVAVRPDVRLHPVGPAAVTAICTGLLLPELSQERP